MKKYKLAIFAIVLSIMFIVGGFIGIYQSQDKMEFYKPSQVELQEKLDNIKGIGDTLKVRVESELSPYFDEINETNENKMIKFNKYVLFLIVMTCTGVIGTILSSTYIIIYLHNLESVSEHRDSQNLIAETYNELVKGNKSDE